MKSSVDLCRQDRVFWMEEGIACTAKSALGG